MTFDPTDIFTHQVAFDPAGDFEAFARIVPARWAVYLLGDAEDRPVQWSQDGKSLYLRRVEGVTVNISRYNLATGKRQPWKKLAPRDPAGLIGIDVGRGELAMTPDGRGYVFTYWKVIRNLFLTGGLPH